MKLRRIFRVCLLICGMASVLWMTAQSVRAEQAGAADNQKAETGLREGQIPQEEQILQGEQIPQEGQTPQEGQIPQGKQILQIEGQDIPGLDSEFEAMKEESTFIIEEVERFREEAQRKRIQRIVVIILTFAILGTGIAMGYREKRENVSAPEGRGKNKLKERNGRKR